MNRQRSDILFRFIIPLGVIGIIGVFLFRSFIFHGHIPIPANYMMAWYEPWKSETAVNGVPTIVHKPVIDDAFRHLYPLREFAASVIKDGQWPLWNPYNAAGTPLLGIMHPGYLTPFGIFFLVLPAPMAWGWYIMLQLVTLGIAVYWYGLTMKLSPRSSLISAVTVMLSGFSVVRLEYGEFLYVLSGLPVLLGLVELHSSKETHRGIFLVPAVVAVMMLSGQPHMIIYTLSVFALYTFMRLPFAGTLRTGGLALLGVGLSAIQLVPSVELYTLSTITRETSSFIFERFLLPFSHLITIVIPNYFGNQATYNYFGPHDYTETTAYVGSVPVFLAVMAVWKRWADVRVRFFAALAVFSILTTIDWLGARLFFALPIPVLSADVPSRIFVLSTFAVAMLAGFGFSGWEAAAPAQRKKALMLAGILLSVVAVVTAVVYQMKISCPSLQVPQCRMISLRTTAVELAVFAVFMSAGVVFSRTHGLVRLVSGAMPIFLIAVIGLYNGQKFLPFSPVEMVFPKTPMITALQEETGINRYAGIGSAHIRTNLMAGFRIPSADYFDPLNVRRYAELVSYVNYADKEKGITRSDILVNADATVSAELDSRRNRFWDMTATSVLISRKDEPLPVFGETVWEDGLWRISRRKTALPRAYIAENILVEPDDALQLSKIFDPESDISDTVFVEVPIGGLQRSGTQKGQASVMSYLPNRVIINTETAAASMLVLSDTYYPGWIAIVDGVEREIYRVNYAFRGVVVPGGRHTVEFRYEPESLRTGIWISGISLVVWLGVVYVKSRKRYKLLVQ